MDPVASISIDLDDKWSYLKTAGVPSWSTFPSFLEVVIPRMEALLDGLGVHATFFAVGHDADRPAGAAMLRALVGEGHEVANHSYRHDPWLQALDPADVWVEVHEAHDAIARATGVAPVGFRGPGYSLSEATLRALVALDYRYDSSMLPTWIGPLARRHYARHAQADAGASERAELFGTWRDGIQPLRPFQWRAAGPGTTAGFGTQPRLLELPVTTMPRLRLPIHFTYLLFLAARSPRLADVWFRRAITTCAARRLSVVLLLHPLEFLDPDDAAVDGLDFLPLTGLTYAAKRDLLRHWLTVVTETFPVVTLQEQARRVAPGTAASRPVDAMGAR